MYNFKQDANMKYMTYFLITGTRIHLWFYNNLFLRIYIVAFLPIGFFYKNDKESHKMLRLLLLNPYV